MVDVKEIASKGCVIPRTVKKGVDAVEGVTEKGIDAITGISTNVPVTHGTLVEGQKDIGRELKNKIRNGINSVRLCNL